MMDYISPEDRKLIDQFTRERGVTQIPTGQSAFASQYVWRGNQLVSLDPENQGWRSAVGKQTPTEDDQRKDTEIAEAIREGRAAMDIIRSHTTTRQRIQRVARQNGLTLKRGPHGTKGSQLTLDDALTQRIAQYVDGKRSCTAIAKLAGCCRSGVMRRKERFGWDIPDKSGRSR